MQKQLIKVVAASLLGDAHIEKSQNGNARFSLKLISDHKDHLFNIGEYLAELTKVSTYTTEATQYEIKGKMCNIKETTTIRTMAHPMYTKIHERMYLNRIKRVDPHYLTLIDAEFMAIWYMQDGYLHFPKDCDKPTPGFVLCTDNFTYGDQMLLREAIKEKTGFVFNVQRRGLNSHGEQAYRLYMTRKQTKDFAKFLAPHIQPSFMYKIDIER